MQAEDCDYESSRDLGLRCPFCSEAVFLRRGTIRDRKGKREVVMASFAHYAGNPHGDHCELRSQSAEGIAHVKKIALERHNQRLKLYNDRLWDLIASDRNVSRRALMAHRKWLGDRRLGQVAITARKRWDSFTREGNTYRLIDEAITIILSNSGKRYYADPLMLEESQAQSAWMQGVDLALHQTICTEVSDFLATRTAGYAWERITAALVLMARTAGGCAYPEDFDADAVITMLPGFIAGTHWREAIATFLD